MKITLATRAKPLVCSREDLKTRYLGAYNDLVSRVGKSVGSSSSWWFTPLSCRERAGSSVQQAYHTLAALHQAMDDGVTAVKVGCSDAATYLIISAWAGKHRVAVSAPRTARLSWWVKSVLHRGLSLYHLLAVSTSMLRYWYVGSRYGWRLAARSLDAIFISPMHRGDFDHPESRDHRYFGPLPRRAAQAGQRVLLAGPLATGALGQVATMQARVHLRAAPLAGLISTRDLFGTIIRLVREVLQPCPAMAVHCPLAGDLSGLMPLEYRAGIWGRLQGRIIERASLRLLRRNPTAHILQTYENNSWERGVYMAATQQQAATTIYGYLHCAILPSHLKLYAGAQGLEHGPQPNFIVTTGPGARNALVDLSGLDSPRFLSGMALREKPDEFERATNPGPRESVHVLMLLEGLPTMVEFIELALDAMECLPHAQFTVRFHPVMPLESQEFDRIRPRLLKHAAVSRNSDLRVDLKNSDVLLYQGSSAVMYGAQRGMPLLRYDCGWWLSDDPLFQCSSLKREFSSPEGLADGFRSLTSLSNECFTIEQAALIRHAESCFSHEPEDRQWMP